MNDWCPFAVKVKAPATGPHDTSYPWRGVLHTTESSTYSPSASSYFGHQSWPHFTVEGDTAYQHLALSQYAKALKSLSGGVETNRARAVQIEVVARAASPNWPDTLTQTVRRLIGWINDETGIQPVAPAFVAYPQSYGVGAAQRLSQAKWRTFNGWCGHQHVPENDHGDPGAINIEALLEDDMTPAQMEALADKVADKVWAKALRTAKAGTGEAETARQLLVSVWQRARKIDEGK